ncbi:unnamed protein product [Protopolystoma xenopodis]|uniref:Uncharacterized protein n=1 Tax=Protopolystoma xenopodis TaxID=117903 RepID=A0A3S5A1X6_9PLAT|nr:unnamed protein product [Protopolystoma xenopodis]
MHMTTDSASLLTTTTTSPLFDFVEDGSMKPVDGFRQIRPKDASAYAALRLNVPLEEDTSSGFTSSTCSLFFTSSSAYNSSSESTSGNHAKSDVKQKLTEQLRARRNRGMRRPVLRRLAKQRCDPRLVSGASSREGEVGVAATESESGVSCLRKTGAETSAVQLPNVAGDCLSSSRTL